MYHLVLFDFDGTLADTLPFSLRVFNELAEKHGFLPIEDVEGARRLSMVQFLTEYKIPLRKVPKITRQFIKKHREHMPHAAVFPGMDEALRQMAERSRLAVVSSNSRRNVTTCLKANGVDYLFDRIVGHKRLLGKSRSIKKVIRKLKLTPADCLYVGDEQRDIEAAREVGCDVAAVTWGIHPAEMLELQSPTYLVHTPTELLGVATRRPPQLGLAAAP